MGRDILTLDLSALIAEDLLLLVDLGCRFLVDLLRDVINDGIGQGTVVGGSVALGVGIQLLALLDHFPGWASKLLLCQFQYLLCFL